MKNDPTLLNFHVFDKEWGFAEKDDDVCEGFFDFQSILKKGKSESKETIKLMHNNKPAGVIDVFIKFEPKIDNDDNKKDSK